MPNTAKQEAIRKAYGEYWEQVKDKVDSYGRLTIPQCWDLWNGDSAESHFYSVILQDKVLDLHDDYQGYYQPKSLQGIENNNGWIRYEDVRPTESGLYFVIRKMTGNINYEIFSNGFSYYPENPVTHWQPIVKPEKPIY